MTLSSFDMQLIRQLARQQTGIVVHSDKQELVQARLIRIAHLNGLSSVEQLMHKLRHQPDESLRQQIAESLLTKETQFFREPQIFSLAAELIAEQAEPSDEDYYLWSAACSTGQEPYSLAMLLTETGLLNRRPMKIIASDISEDALLQAKVGIYSDFELGRGLSVSRVRQHFIHYGDEHKKISPGLQKLVEFKKINLTGTWPPLPQMDMIFLRNVLIYFDLETKSCILTRLQKLLKPNGYLIVGTGETPDKINAAFRQIKLGKNFVYQRAE